MNLSHSMTADATGQKPPVHRRRWRTVLLTAVLLTAVWWWFADLQLMVQLTAISQDVYDTGSVKATRGMYIGYTLELSRHPASKLAGFLRWSPSPRWRGVLCQVLRADLFPLRQGDRRGVAVALATTMTTDPDHEVRLLAHAGLQFKWPFVEADVPELLALCQRCGPSNYRLNLLRRLAEHCPGRRPELYEIIAGWRDGERLADRVDAFAVAARYFPDRMDEWIDVAADVFARASPTVALVDACESVARQRPELYGRINAVADALWSLADPVRQQLALEIWICGPRADSRLLDAMSAPDVAKRNRVVDVIRRRDRYHANQRLPPSMSPEDAERYLTLLDEPDQELRCRLADTLVGFWRFPPKSGPNNPAHAERFRQWLSDPALDKLTLAYFTETVPFTLQELPLIEMALRRRFKEENFRAGAFFRMQRAFGNHPLTRALDRDRRRWEAENGLNVPSPYSTLQ